MSLQGLTQNQRKLSRKKKKSMMEVFNLCGVDILSHISSYLSQRDVVSWSETSKQFSKVYPKNVVKYFQPDATEEEYTNFLLYVSKRPIETLKVYVDPYIWNPLASTYLHKRHFKQVTVAPNNPSMYEYIHDKTSWIPNCDEYISGFASTMDHIHTRCVFGKLYMWTNQTSFPDIPYVDQYTGVHSVVCSGRFLKYERLWDIRNIYMKMTTITMEMLQHLAQCQYVGIGSCDFEVTAKPLTFDAEIITVGLDAFSFIYDAPQCTQMVITSHGPLSDRYKYIRRDFQRGMYKSVEKVTLDGHLNDTDFEEFSRFLRDIFPSHTVFQFHIRLVNV